MAMFSIKGKKVQMQIDSWTMCNVMPKKKLPNAEMHKCKKSSLYMVAKQQSQLLVSVH